jgi:hypothetical protein
MLTLSGNEAMDSPAEVPDERGKGLSAHDIWLWEAGRGQAGIASNDPERKCVRALPWRHSSNNKNEFGIDHEAR